MRGCTCGLNDDMIGGPHEPNCGIAECGKCGTVGSHSEQNCPEFRAMSCCGADSLCRLCPFMRQAA